MQPKERLNMPTIDVMDRFWAKVLIDAETDCWNWNASTDHGGYGQFWADGRLHIAHRWSFEHFQDKIPSGLDVDHLCRNRACVNPAHLEPVTRSVNLRRGVSAQASKTHCKYGHEFTPENTKRLPASGYRMCRRCIRERARRYYEASRSARGAE
jgi:hypothetical protein